jgi:hypothetical protein
MQAVLERLERLERQNRRVKQGVVISLIAVASIVFLAEAEPKSTTIEATKFVLKDTEERTRAELGMVENSPRLQLSDAMGSPQVVLTGGDYSFLTLTRAGTVDQVTLTNSPILCGLALIRKQGGPTDVMRVALGTYFGARPALALYDETGQERAKIKLLPTGEPALPSPTRTENSTLSLPCSEMAPNWG